MFFLVKYLNNKCILLNIIIEKPGLEAGALLFVMGTSETHQRGVWTKIYIFKTASVRVHFWKKWYREVGFG